MKEERVFSYFTDVKAGIGIFIVNQAKCDVEEEVLELKLYNGEQMRYLPQGSIRKGDKSESIQ